MKKKVIAHLMPKLPFGGGAEHVLLDICRQVDPRRYQIVVFFWDDDDALASMMRDAGAVVEKLCFKHIISPASVGCLMAALKKYQVDLLHTHFMDSDLLGVIAARIVGIPLVLHVHSFPFPQERRHVWRYRLLAPWISKIICVSTYMRAQSILSTGINKDKFVVLVNGIDLERFRDVLSGEQQQALRAQMGIGLRDKVVGTVGRLSPDKNVDVFLHSIPFILEQYPDARFLVIGDGIERQRLEALSQELHLVGRVIFTGKQQGIPGLLNIMDVFVLASVGEAFGVVLLEAFAAGKPVVAARAAAIPDIVSDDKEGLLFSPGEAKALAAAVLRLLDDPVLAQRLTTEAYRRVGAFTASAMARGLEKIYDEVLARG